MKTLLTFLEQIGHTFPIELKEDAEIILSSSELSPEVARAITRIWGNRNLQVSYLLTSPFDAVSSPILYWIDA
jgi:hypothetical protein